MTTVQTDELTSRKPLRLWPGVVAVALQWLLWFGLPVVAPEALIGAVIGGLACALAVLVWWLFWGRAPWAERLGAIGLMVVSVVATKRVVHPSIAGGMMGMMLPIFSIPVLSLALVAAAAAGRRLSSGPRRASMVAAILLACAVFTLIRTGGINGEGSSDLHWRWKPPPHRPPPPPPPPRGAGPAAARPSSRGRPRHTASNQDRRSADGPDVSAGGREDSGEEWRRSRRNEHGRRLARLSGTGARQRDS